MSGYFLSEICVAAQFLRMSPLHRGRPPSSEARKVTMPEAFR